jgi:hypothetical protein
LADLTKEVEGAAAQQADPFAKFNVAMDNLKEKLGNVILPYLSDFIDEMMKPGGAIDQVGKFLEDVSNPKTEAGKMFLQVKDAVTQTIDGVKEFFALFGGGDAMKGFGVVVSNLVKALPALLALKGIMMLASATTTITNLAKAIGLISAQNAAGGGGLSGFVTKNKLLGVAVMYSVPLLITSETLSVIDQEFKNPEKRARLAEAAKSKLPAYNPGMNKGLYVDSKGFDSSGTFVGLGANGNNILNIYVTNADPKATVDAIAKYVKTNGALPSYFVTGQARR